MKARTLFAAVLVVVFAGSYAFPGKGDTTGPRRIVAVGGTVTEILHALGAEDRIIAVDSTSRYPESVRGLPNVGYKRTLSAEPIAALAPDMVIAEADSGPPSALSQLRGAGVNVTLVPVEPTRAGVAARIRAVARAVGLSAEGDTLADRVDSEFAAALAAVGAGPRPRVLFLLSVARGGLLAAGRDTAADSIIALAGGENAVQGYDGYKPLTAEALLAQVPDVLLLSEEGLRLVGGTAGLFAQPNLPAVLSSKRPRVVAMDGLLLLGFGPRAGQAVRQLADALDGASVRTQR
jgi:iron complex transport system substrate-binding protein